jgi:hypothetical protein
MEKTPDRTSTRSFGRGRTGWRKKAEHLINSGPRDVAAASEFYIEVLMRHCHLRSSWLLGL